MFYIYQATCISPQQTFTAIDLNTLHEPVNHRLTALEPAHYNVPANILRRMSKTVKIGMAAAMPLLNREQPPDGIIIGTANGGMEESGRFLNQIVEYNEDMLTPGNFVQSTPHAVSSQLSMLLGSKKYNITHVQRGLAFENAAIDAAMLCNENPAGTYLLGGVDEIAAYHYEVDRLDGWYRQDDTGSKNLYNAGAAGSIAGEGAAMFLIGQQPQRALARLKAATIIHTDDITVFGQRLADFLAKNLPEAGQPDLLISGENGDERLLKYYAECERQLNPDAAIARYKHMSGEYPTASAFALWLSCQLLSSRLSLPGHMIKRAGRGNTVKSILIYNNYKGTQHSLMLVE